MDNLESRKQGKNSEQRRRKSEDAKKILANVGGRNSAQNRSQVIEGAEDDGTQGVSKRHRSSKKSLTITIGVEAFGRFFKIKETFCLSTNHKALHLKNELTKTCSWGLNKISETSNGNRLRCTASNECCEKVFRVFDVGNHHRRGKATTRE